MFSFKFNPKSSFRESSFRESSFRAAISGLPVTLMPVAFIAMGVVSPAIAQEHRSWIEDNQTKRITGYLLQGESVSGLCDEDCSNLDLFLYNEMGIMVDSDDGVDANPIVTAPYEGTFVVEVSVPSCTHWAGCAVSIRSDKEF